MYCKALKAIHKSVDYYEIRITIAMGSVDGLIPGLSHLIEHLIVLNEAEKGLSLKKLVTLSGGKISAYTTRTETVVKIEGMKDIKRVSSGIKSVFSQLYISEECLQNELQVIRQEILYRKQQQGYKQNNNEYTYFMGDKETILGNVDKLATLSMSMLEEYYQRFYTLPHISIDILGNADHIACVQEIFLIPQRFILDECENRLVIAVTAKQLIKRFFILAFGDLLKISFHEFAEIEVQTDGELMTIRISTKDRIHEVYESIIQNYILEQKEQLLTCFYKRVQEIKESNSQNLKDWTCINEEFLYIQSMVTCLSKDSNLWNELLSQFNQEIIRILLSKIEVYENFDVTDNLEIRNCERFTYKTVSLYHGVKSWDEKRNFIIFAFRISDISGEENVILGEHFLKQYFSGKVLYKNNPLILSYSRNPEVIHIILEEKDRITNQDIVLFWQYVCYVTETIISTNKEFKIHRKNVFEGMYIEVLNKLHITNMTSFSGQTSTFNLFEKLLAVILVDSCTQRRLDYEKVLEEMFQTRHAFPIKTRLKYEKPVNGRGDTASILFWANGVPLNSSEKFKLHVLWKILDNPGGLFITSLRDCGGKIYVEKAFSQEFYTKGIFVIYIACSTSKQDGVIQRILSILEQIYEETVLNDSILESAKKALILDYKKRRNCKSSLIEFCNYVIYGNQDKHLDYEQMVEKVTIEDLQKLSESIRNELNYDITCY